jgi:mRNA-degrading endonuclease toxin of MazEF toxin-antitoxin module
MKRGEIYCCDLDARRGHEQGARRPVVIAVAKNPVHVRLTKEETGLEANSTALVDHARFLDRTRLGPSPAGRLIPEAQSRLDRNLARAPGL